MSVQRAPGDRLHGFEEAARWLRLIGKGDVHLEMGFGAAHGQTLDDQSGSSGFCQQRIGASERRGAAIVHDEVAGGGGFADRPFRWHAWERVAAGPALRVEGFEFDIAGPAQHAADNEGVAPAAAAAERPHPRHIARLKEDDLGRAGERGLALADHHFDGARAEPPHSGVLAEHRQAALHPLHKHAAPTDIPDRAGGKPANERNRGNGDDFHHGGPDDSTPGSRQWSRVLREFIYGMTSYEFVQQALEMRASMQKLFMVGVFGDMLGVPILPPYYGLRLLPWVVPEIEAWKREVLRERELGSSHEHHLHGL